MCKSILNGQNVPGTDGTYHGTDGTCPRDRRDAHQGVSRQNSLCLLVFFFPQKRGLWEGVVQEPLRRALFCVFLCSEVIFSCKSHRNFFQKLPLQRRHFLENPLAKNPKTQLLKKFVFNFRPLVLNQISRNPVYHPCQNHYTHEITIIELFRGLQLQLSGVFRMN